MTSITSQTVHQFGWLWPLGCIVRPCSYDARVEQAANVLSPQLQICAAALSVR